MPTLTDVSGYEPRAWAVPDVGYDAVVRHLNDDFERECRGVIAYAVYAERSLAADFLEARGEQEVAHALAVAQLIHDLGGSLTATVDEWAAVRSAARVADPDWADETANRLRERADELAALGLPGLASRLTELAGEKERLPDLPAILGRGAERV